MKKSTEALDVLKNPEKSDCKMGKNVFIQIIPDLYFFTFFPKIGRAHV